MRGIVTPMSFLPPKAPKPTNRPMLGFRPLREQAEYVEAMKQRGYAVTDLLNNVIHFYMDVEERLSGVMQRVEAFAIESGIAKPPDKREPGDIRWVGLAVAELARRGLEGHEANKKSNGKK